MWGYIVVAVLFSYFAFKAGRKYSDFSDLMLARRVSKLVRQADQLRLETNEWERMVNDRVVRGNARGGENVSDDAQRS